MRTCINIHMFWFYITVISHSGLEHVSHCQQQSNTIEKHISSGDERTSVRGPKCARCLGLVAGGENRGPETPTLTPITRRTLPFLWGYLTFKSTSLQKLKRHNVFFFYLFVLFFLSVTHKLALEGKSALYDLATRE